MTVASSGVGAGCPFEKRTYDEFFLLMRHVTMRTHLGLGKDTPLGRAHESRSGRSRKTSPPDGHRQRFHSRKPGTDRASHNCSFRSALEWMRTSDYWQRRRLLPATSSSQD
jgi:hypothetical protein